MTDNGHGQKDHDRQKRAGRVNQHQDLANPFAKQRAWNSCLS